MISVDAHRVVMPQHGLQFQNTLPRNAASLAPFLDTLIGNDRPKFEEIEDFVIRVFPEFRHVNPEKSQNSVSLTLSKRDGGDRIPLSHCGTGVEQILAIATFVLTARRGSTILLDEPHSYLHPTAEHDVISFLLDHKEHSYFISSHSSILINSVSADRILALSPPRMPKTNDNASSDLAGILRSLGYKNSDFLFSDRLIFVEGQSDQEILPILLSLNPRFNRRDIDRTGFPSMGGDGKLRSSKNQKSLINFEKLIDQLGKVAIPRIYLFDGDCKEDERLIRDMPYIQGRPGLSVRFLQRREIENYLLVTEAILVALQKLRTLSDGQPGNLNASTLRTDIQTIQEENDASLYPGGRTGSLEHTVKGSVVLERLFRKYSASYNKRSTGRLIAEQITLESQPALTEIWELVGSIFA